MFSGTNRIYLALLTSCLSLAGCASAPVRTDFDSSIDFLEYRDFSWREPPLKETGEREPDPFARNSLLDKRVRDAIAAELALRGLASVDPAEADLLVDYRVIYSERLVAHETHRPVPFRRYYPFLYDVDVHVSEVPQATLLIDLIDSETEQLVWRGWVEGRDFDRNLDDREVIAAVQAILRRYPPVPRAR
jgi:hypothetical protein